VGVYKSHIKSNPPKNMSKNKLKNVTIIGFFSMPSPSLAEHNPAAYNNLMKNIPWEHGAGQCSHCGMGILHHVVIKDETGQTRFIGTQCAEKVGCDSTALKYRRTTEEQAAIDAKRDARNAILEKLSAERDIKKAEHLARVGYIITMMESKIAELKKSADETNDPWTHKTINFYSSLLESLKIGTVSEKQANYIAKATSATGRQTNSNFKEWYRIIAKCAGYYNQPEFND
jgi:hypothetical protein